MEEVRSVGPTSMISTYRIGTFGPDLMPPTQIQTDPLATDPDAVSWDRTGTGEAPPRLVLTCSFHGRSIEDSPVLNTEQCRETPAITYRGVLKWVSDV